MWYLFQTVSTAGWDHFKVLPQPDSPSLVEAMRTLYGPNLPQEPSLDTEMAVDQPVVEEAPFTTVTNKKSKGKGKVPPSTNPSAPSQNVPTPVPVVSRVPPPPPPAKTATAKPTPAKVATKPQMPKQAPKSFAQAACSGNPQSTPRFAPASLLTQSMRVFSVSVICFPTFLWRRFLPCTSLALVLVPLQTGEVQFLLVPQGHPR